MRRGTAILSILLLSLLVLQTLPAGGIRGTDASWTVTTADRPWRDAGPVVLSRDTGEGFDIAIDKSLTAQTIDGFGGTFNEKGWVALSMLSPAERDEVLRAFFDPDTGACFNICRVPIGASDYAVDRYTLDEVPGDYDMRYFSIERDRQYLIPYIKAAMEVRPDLRIWASAWTPPTWMKSNGEFDGGEMKDDPRTYDAYALYLARFLESYRAEGIDAYAVCVQNEPTISTNYPSCLWTEQQVLIFIRNHLGPLFKARGVRGEIWLGTIQDGDYTKYPATVLADEQASAYVTTVGFQWDGLYSVEWTRRHYPDKRIMQTETECGNFYWKAGFDPDKPQNDWNYGVYTWNKVKEYFTKGANSYMLWNMVLDQEGKSIDALRPWPQNAAVVVDSRTKTVTYTPMYYAFKHFSHFVKPGALLIKTKTTGTWQDALAFKNPDGSLVLVLQNATVEQIPLKVKVGKKAAALMLPPESWSTLVLP